jgi:hypothetical protein
MGNHLKFLRVLGVSCSLLLTVSPTWSQVGAEAPKVAKQPVQVIPVPNALEYFVKASDAVVDKDALWDKLTLPQKQGWSRATLRLCERCAKASLMNID